MASAPSETDRKLAQLRNGLMAIEHATGATLGELSQKYRLTREAVKAALTDAAQSGMIDALRAGAVDGLAPTALAVYELHLKAGSLEAARDLLFGLGVLQRDAAKGVVREKITETLSSYRAVRAEIKAADRLPAKAKGGLWPPKDPESVQ